MLNLSVSVGYFNVGSIADKDSESIRANHVSITVAQETPGRLPQERERDGPTAAQENVLCFGEDVAIEVLSLEGKEPLSSMSSAQRVQPCRGDPLEPHGGFSIPLFRRWQL